MKKCFLASLLVLFLNLASLLPSSACPYCPYPIPSHTPPPKSKPPPPPPKVNPPPPPQKLKPPPLPPKVKPPPPPPKVQPPTPPPKLKPPPAPPKIKPTPPPPPKFKPLPPPKVLPPPPPEIKPPPPPPKIKPLPPPKVLPPPLPKINTPPPPKVLAPPPPKVKPPPHEVPYPPPPPVAPKCPINTLKLDACVDLLGGLVHTGIGSGANRTCCPVLEGLADMDAALCFCTAIRAKLLNINILLPIALEVLVDCGKHIPSDYKCPAA